MEKRKMNARWKERMDSIPGIRTDLHSKVRIVPSVRVMDMRMVGVKTRLSAVVEIVTSTRLVVGGGRWWWWTSHVRGEGTSCER